MKSILLLIIFVQILCYSQFAGGSGTAENPWLIRTPENLDSIRYFLGSDNADKFFKQIERIDLGIAPWNESKGWIPIGNGLPGNEFMGKYIGYTIDDVYIDPNIVNLTIADSTLDYAGLFGHVNNAVLENIYLSNTKVIGGSKCGSLVGYSNLAKIIKCSSNNGSVTGSGDEIGGLIGVSACDSILYSYSISNVKGNNYIGGLLGSNIAVTTLIDCYSRGNVEGISIIGGMIGALWLSEIKNCYSSAIVTGDTLTGGLVGIGNEIQSSHSYWDTEASGQLTSECGEGRNTYEMSIQYSDSVYVNWDFSNIWRCESYHYGWGYPNFVWDLLFSSIENNELSPNDFKLFQNYPNPFNPTTEINFEIDEAQNVNLSVYNSKGELVQTLFDGKKEKGLHSISFDASRLNTGIYFYKLTAEGDAITRKMLLLR